MSLCNNRTQLELSSWRRYQYTTPQCWYIWLDESGCDRRNTVRKYGYSLRGMPMSDHRILVRGKRYSVIPIISLEGIHDVYITEGTVNGEKFAN